MKPEIIKMYLPYFLKYFLDLREEMLEISKDKKKLIFLENRMLLDFREFIQNDLQTEMFNEVVLSKQSFVSFKAKDIKHFWTHSLINNRSGRTIDMSLSIDITFFKESKPVFSLIYFPFRDILYLAIVNDKNYYVHGVYNKFYSSVGKNFEDIFAEIVLSTHTGCKYGRNSEKKVEELIDLVDEMFVDCEAVKCTGSDCFIKLAKGEIDQYVYPSDSFLWESVSGYLFAKNIGKTMIQEDDNMEFDFSVFFYKMPHFKIS